MDHGGRDSVEVGARELTEVFDDGGPDPGLSVVSGASLLEVVVCGLLERVVKLGLGWNVV